VFILEEHNICKAMCRNILHRVQETVLCGIPQNNAKAIHPLQVQVNLTECGLTVIPQALSPVELLLVTVRSGQKVS
jgi:hypothetical protein